MTESVSLGRGTPASGGSSCRQGCGGRDGTGVLPEDVTQAIRPGRTLSQERPEDCMGPGWPGRNGAGHLGTETPGVHPGVSGFLGKLGGRKPQRRGWAGGLLPFLGHLGFTPQRQRLRGGYGEWPDVRATDFPMPLTDHNAPCFQRTSTGGTLVHSHPWSLPLPLRCAQMRLHPVGKAVTSGGPPAACVLPLRGQTARNTPEPRGPDDATVLPPPTPAA